jgi:hypothetical protein
VDVVRIRTRQNGSIPLYLPAGLPVGALRMLMSVLPVNVMSFNHAACVIREGCQVVRGRAKLRRGDCCQKLQEERSARSRERHIEIMLYYWTRRTRQQVQGFGSPQPRGVRPAREKAYSFAGQSQASKASLSLLAMMVSIHRGDLTPTDRKGWG